MTEPTEMELRVAIALCESDSHLWAEAPDYHGRQMQRFYIDHARSAIRAMREPTTPLIDAALKYDGKWSISSIRRLKNAWRTMIDAASPPDTEADAPARTTPPLPSIE